MLLHKENYTFFQFKTQEKRHIFLLIEFET